MSRNIFIEKDPKADLKLQYRKIFEAALIVALILLIGMFYSFMKFESEFTLEKKVDVKIETIDIPLTEQFNRPPPPARPTIPVASEDEDFPDEETIEETEIDFADLSADEPPPPPPEEEEPIVEFYALSDKPEVIQRTEPVYPELARKAGIEGMVVVKVLISTKGDVEQVQVVKSHPMLDDAAMAAAKKFKFKPGKQRDRFVKVWMTIPFTFRLRK